MIVVLRPLAWAVVAVPLLLLFVIFVMMLLLSGFDAEGRGFNPVFSAGSRLLRFAGLNT
jgi:hypothetical protein